MTDEKNIEQLLASFYSGATTPEEEEVLWDFFKNQPGNKKFQADCELFKMLYDSSRIPLPDGFTERLEKTIDDHILQSSTPQRPEKTIDKPLSGITKQKMRKLYIQISSVAAVVLLCMGLFFLTGKRNTSPSFSTDTYTNPEDAAIAVEQALLLVSTKLNQGLTPLEKAQESVNTANQLLNEMLH
jgi:uncharacterized membrane protein YvbJ